MSLINIPAFSGLNILAAPQRIREDEATVAIGCDFRSLDLRAFHDDKDSGMGVSDPTSIQANGASIFQWDDTHWIGTLGDKNFARSPTFYADGTTGQRIFVCDNAAPYAVSSPEVAWNWVQEVELNDLSALGMRTNSYFLGGSTRRLGVLKPAAINMDNVIYTPRNGRVTGLYRFTNTDSKITVDAPDSLKPGDRIYLDVPAIGDGPYPISKKSTDATPQFTIRSARLAYVTVKASMTANSRVLTFKKTNHGLVGGEQVILNRAAGTEGGLFATNKLPPTYNQNLFTVVYEGPDEFSLLWADSGEALQTTEDGNPDVTPSVRYALVAAPGDDIDISLVGPTLSVIPYGTSNLNQELRYLSIPEGVTSNWEAAIDSIMERSYVVTFVNEFGDESEPSEPTKVIAVAQGDPVTFVVFPVIAATYPAYLVTGPGGSYQTGEAPILEKYRIPEKIRLYRTDASGTYRLVTTEADDDRTILWSEVANNDGSPITINWVDDYEDTELGEPLSTQGWQIPPRDLNGILISPGGSLVGYKDRGVFGSVPYAPYAFPIGNRVAFDYNVKGLVATSSGIVVVTDGMPALIVGDDPAAWSIQKLEYPYGCVSRRSIVDLGEMAIYASADGLIGIAGANVEILTKETIKREDWQSLYNPANIIAAHAEGRYYAITQLGDGTRKAFMFDPRTRSFINLTVGTPYPIALYSRLTDDTLLILKSDGKAYEWNRGTNWVEYTWQSKWFQLTRPDILGCGQILSPALIANYSVAMTLYGWDGENVVQICKYTTGAADPTNKIYPFDKNVNPFRLPVPPDRYTVYTVKLEGSLPVGQVSLASTIDEIKQV